MKPLRTYLPLLRSIIVASVICLTASVSTASAQALSDACLKDESNLNSLHVDLVTGDYQFTKGGASNFFMSGRGTVVVKGCTITLNHSSSDRRVVVKIDNCSKRATASLQILSPRETLTIIDRNIADSLCQPSQTGVITPQGGTIAIPGFTTVTFPPGVFPSDTPVKVSITQSAETREDFDVTTTIFNVNSRLPFEVRINTGGVAPATSFQTDIRVPDSYLEGLPSNAEIQVFAEIFEESELDSLYSFELFTSAFNTATKIVQATLPPESFTDTQNVNGDFVAVVVVGTTPTKPLTSVAQSFPARAENGSAILTPQADPPPCEGSSLGSPLEGELKVNDSFKPNGPPRPHLGTDYDASNGDNVLAAADGVIQMTGEQVKPIPKPDSRSGRTIQGWGKFIVLRHADGSGTLYAHLQDFMVTKEQTVTKGSVIGHADSTGGVSGPHLHLEYSPNGQFTKGSKKIDPHPCINANLTGSITVRDNGTLADDAFQLLFDGIPLGQTSIGGANTFAANNLRSGTHMITIVAIVAPDDVGTFEVSLADGVTFQGGGTTRSGSLPQGGSAVFTIIVP